MCVCGGGGGGAQWVAHKENPHRVWGNEQIAMGMGYHRGPEWVSWACPQKTIVGAQKGKTAEGPHGL